MRGAFAVSAVGARRRGRVMTCGCFARADQTAVVPHLATPKRNNLGTHRVCHATSGTPPDAGACSRRGCSPCCCQQYDACSPKTLGDRGARRGESVSFSSDANSRGTLGLFCGTSMTSSSSAVLWTPLPDSYGRLCTRAASCSAFVPPPSACASSNSRGGGRFECALPPADFAAVLLLVAATAPAASSAAAAVATARRRAARRRLLAAPPPTSAACRGIAPRARRSRAVRAHCRISRRLRRISNSNSNSNSRRARARAAGAF